jgi:exopolysaccharide biosynthesis polyprenyl glycosylphosphotransferase
MAEGLGIGGLPVGLRRSLARAPVVLGALAAAALVWRTGTLEAAGLALVAYLVAGWLSVRAGRWRWLLPLAGLLSSAVFPTSGTVFTIALLALRHEPIDAAGLVPAAIAGFVVFTLGMQLTARWARVRVGVIGSPFEAQRLRDELERTGRGEYEVAATITPDDWPLDLTAIAGPYLVALSDIGRAIDERDLEILVVTQEFDQRQVAERLYREVITRPVALMELAEFHEARFGAVPLAEIDPTWFTHLAGRHHRPLGRAVKRALDIAICAPVLLLLSPLVLLFAVLVRRDGGPALFRQQRVGEGGTPFEILKLRTMSVAPPEQSAWTTDNDVRVTKVGAFLRRSHLDEAPQLLNILRGDMSLVGPRPEQVAYVTRLAEQIPFYNQRHIVKPGLTGWAQVRIGYAGSTRGTLFKLCNDLYYVKHHSLSLDLTILLETVRTLVADRQFAGEPPTSSTMIGSGPRAIRIELDDEP